MPPLSTDDTPMSSSTGWSTLHRHHIGVDIGGTAIKYAVVDMADGRLTTPVLQLPTPQEASPEDVAEVLGGLLERLQSRPQAPDPAASAGVTLPAIVRHGVARSAANIDSAWIGLDAERFLGERLGRTVHALNDADAAGLAEVRYGAGRGPDGRPATGTVLVLTLGTGTGSVLFVDGRLVPNLELGHLELDGAKAETRASAAAREREGLDWPPLHRAPPALPLPPGVPPLPDLVVVGGGISARYEEFLPACTWKPPSFPPSCAMPPGSSAPPATPTSRHRPCSSWTSAGPTVSPGALMRNQVWLMPVHPAR